MTPFLSKFVCEASKVEISKEHSARQIYIPIIPYVMKAIFQLLVPNDDGQCYWPRLQVIESTIYTGLGLDDQIVLTFIQKRIAAVAVPKYKGDILPLREVTICFHRAKQINIASILEEYIKNGLRLNLHGYWKSWDAAESNDIFATPGKFDCYAGIVHDDKTVVPF
jgi:hypothetical protein